MSLRTAKNAVDDFCSSIDEKAKVIKDQKKKMISSETFEEINLVYSVMEQHYKNILVLSMLLFAELGKKDIEIKEKQELIQKAIECIMDNNIDFNLSSEKDLKIINQLTS